MPPKKIFILNGHPGQTSLSRSFADTYAEGARKAGHDVRLMHLPDMSFDPDFGQGSFVNPKPLEPDLEAFMDNLEWCDHMVLTTAMWWGGLPAKLKGVFDRSFLPGRTFDTRNKTTIGLPAPMLTGRTARVILTSDTPNWFFHLSYSRALIHQLRGQIFGFVGFKPTRVTHFTGASDPKPGQVDGWMSQIAELGQNGI